MRTGWWWGLMSTFSQIWLWRRWCLALCRTEYWIDSYLCTSWV